MSAPRQQAIGTAMLARIAAGEWAGDSRLPVERELAELFGCTRITLREALHQLEAEGHIYRENRRGWFVSAARVRHDANSIAGFMQYVTAQGRVPRTELLSVQRQPAGMHAAAMALQDPHEDVFVLQRRRWIGRRAVLLETNIVLTAWAPQLLDHDLAGSLGTVLARLGLRHARSRLTMHPASLDAAQATLLQSTAGTACFRLQRANFDGAGRIVEYDIELWRHDVLEVVVDVEAPEAGKGHPGPATR